MRTRIADVRVRILHADLDNPIAVSFGAMTRRSMALVEVELDDGTVGLGESWINYPSWAAAEREATIGEGVAPLLVGEDATRVVDLQAKLRAALVPLGRQWGAPGPIAQAISGVDIALWDLHAKQHAVGIASLLGGRSRDRVRVYASGLGPSAVGESSARCRQSGFGMVKLKVGFGRAADLGNLREARDALGSEVKLVVDANQRWSLDDAVEMSGPLREADIAWVEEPIAGNTLAELEEFHLRTGLLVATGENLYLNESFGPYLRSPGIHLLQPDVSKCGGITEFIAICRAAKQAGKPVVPHLYGGGVAHAATLQLAAAFTIIDVVEYDINPNPLRDQLLAKPPRPEAGFLTIPSGPGLGIELDAKYLAEHLECPRFPLAR